MFSSKYGKCQSGSISATPSAEMNSVEMTFAIAVLPSRWHGLRVTWSQRPVRPSMCRVWPCADPNAHPGSRPDEQALHDVGQFPHRPPAVELHGSSAAQQRFDLAHVP